MSATTPGGSLISAPRIRLRNIGFFPLHKNVRGYGLFIRYLENYHLLFEYRYGTFLRGPMHVLPLQDSNSNNLRKLLNKKNCFFSYLYQLDVRILDSTVSIRSHNLSFRFRLRGQFNFGSGSATLVFSLYTAIIVSLQTGAMDQNQLANLSPQQREEIMQTVQAQVALANMQVGIGPHAGRHWPTCR